MASNQSQGTPAVTNAFLKGMSKDNNETYTGEGTWTHARNAVNNSHDGQLGVIGNEPSNIECVTLPYTLIGAIPAKAELWILYTTDDTNSEIGLFDEATCTYTTIVNNSCLNFKRSHLITGATRSTFECTTKVYWSDGLNPDRVLDIDNIPWVQSCTIVDGCKTCTDTNVLDCDKLRIAPLLDLPCLKLTKGVGSGTLPNGTYQVAVAYAVNEIKVTDYVMVSNPVGIWSHQGVGGSVTLNVTNTDSEFDELEVVVISTVAGQTVARRLGIYSSRQEIIYIDTVDPTLPSITLSSISLQTPAIEKADKMFAVNNYLLRSGVYSKVDFNYQPLANKIVTKWEAVQYPADYYHKGGENVGYMRDEVYTFFIRWVYNTGEKSASYHIPGRLAAGGPTYQNLNITLSDGGRVVAEGLMQYWQSTEFYPDNNPTVWNTYPGTTSVYNLCGKTIKHHKFPDNNTIPHFTTGGAFINVLGVKFENISHPLDIDGNPITSIVGYEILRGSREGHKSIIAKGMVNNMRAYSENNRTILFQNYPYNDSFNGDPFYVGNMINGDRRYVSFHSPDTTFQRPFIGQSQLKIYGDVYSTDGRGVFESPYKHPEFKILGNSADTLGQILGTIISISTLLQSFGVGGETTLSGTNDLPFSSTILGPLNIPDLSLPIVGNVLGTVAYVAATAAQIAAGITLSAILGTTYKQKVLDIITGFVPLRQYGLQYNSTAFYDKYQGYVEAPYNVLDYGYIKNSVQSFDSYRVNNLYRNDFVMLKLNNEITLANNTDNSLNIIGDLTGPGNVRNFSVASKYGSLKVNLPSQYGQLNSIRQLPISTCVYSTTPVLNTFFNTGNTPIFGGDTYINRYTEKNQFTFFNDWLINQPADTTYNYKQYQNIPGVKYWVDNRKAYGTLFNSLSNFYSLRQGTTDLGTGQAASGWYADGGWFFISCNGVKDFFVESEVNVGYRDWEDDASKRFYDPYGYQDITEMFRSDIIKSSSYYKYDYSLSVSRLYNQFTTWGEILPRSFDPQVAATCYSYYPKKVIYSLPQNKELKKDNWRVFLVNNYTQFDSNVTSIKSIGKNGAIIFFDKSSPQQFLGVDVLQTEAGTKITIGDGGLFSQPMQAVTNVDVSYQYGSCQNTYGVVSTPAGVFFVSQDQGKIFSMGGGSGLEEISNIGMKFWFSRYLPSNLKKYFPDIDILDNPVIGAGILTVYDNINQIVYFTKKDYIPKDENIMYSTENGFYITRGSATQTIPGGSHYECPVGPYSLFGTYCQHLETQEYVPAILVEDPPVVIDVPAIQYINVCDPAYFEDVSFTVSYDIKNKQWLSFHDWHPTTMIPSKTHFLSAKTGCGPEAVTSLWRHNNSFTSFCNFYGQDYPFEIEYVAATGTTTTSLKSMEYLLEAYRYKENGQDKFHVLDFNFDRAIVYNSEQISGLLRLNIKDRKNPIADLQYPIVSALGMGILYSKEEQKYRFNQFWDITKDRGMYTTNEYNLIETSPNGYVWNVNPVAVDYFKVPEQNKRFRHNVNKVFLRRNVSGDTKINFKTINTKLQNSSR
jgi:hypothetical protein